MNSKPIIIAVFLTVISLVVLGYSILNGSSHRIAVSPNIGYLTEPVTSFSGTVKKIEKNTITLVREGRIEQTSGVSATPFPSMLLSYQVKITPLTRFSRMIIPSDYEEKTGLPLNESRPAASDLKVNQNITVQTASDLRFLKTNSFEATDIDLPPLQKLLTGKLIKIQQNTVVISSPASVSQTSETHSVYLSASTRIVKNSIFADPASAARPEPSTIDAIPPGAELFVYLSASTDEDPLHAVYIEYSSFTPAPSATPGAGTVSPAPETSGIPQVSVAPTGTAP